MRTISARAARATSGHLRVALRGDLEAVSQALPHRQQMMRSGRAAAGGSAAGFEPAAFGRPCRRRSIRAGTGPGLRVLSARASARSSAASRSAGSPWRSPCSGRRSISSIIAAVWPRQDFVEVGAGDAARFGRGERVAAAAAVVGEDLGAGAAGDLGRRRAGDAGVCADVGGDVVEILAGDDVGRHRDRRVVVARPRELDLGLDDAFDRVAVLAGCRAPRRRRRRGWGRSGAVVPACASVWQVPHFWMKRTRPRVGVGGGRAAARGGQRDGRQGGEGEQRADGVRRAWASTARSAPESICRGRRRKRLARACRSGRLEAIRTNSQTEREEGAQMQVRDGMSEVVADGRPVAHAARGGGDDGREGDRRGAGQRRRDAGARASSPSATSCSRSAAARIPTPSGSPTT